MKSKRSINDFPEEDRHLGGHGFKTHLDEGILNFFIEKFSCKTMLDIGCGPGGMIKLADKLGMKAEGIDGDYSIDRDIDIIIHDFTKGSYNHNKKYDLGYSCEFVEHVEEKYILNYMESFKQCKHVIMTFAPPGTKGYHHVNCKTKDYWIDIFCNNGFLFDKRLTEEIRKASTMERNFVRDNGLYFKNNQM